MLENVFTNVNLKPHITTSSLTIEPHAQFSMAQVSIRIGRRIVRKSIFPPSRRLRAPRYVSP